MRRAAPARRLGSPFLTISSSPGISDMATDIKRTQNGRIGGFSRTLGWVREGSVRLGRNSKAAQIRGFGPRGPCRSREKPLYRRQLMVLIRSRIESGPLPDPLFFII